MGQRLSEQLLLAKMVAETGLQLVEILAQGRIVTLLVKLAMPSIFAINGKRDS